MGSLAAAFGTGGIEWSCIEAEPGGVPATFDMACPICGPDRRSRFNQVRKVLRVWRHEEAFAAFSCIRCGQGGWVKPDRNAPSPPRGAHIRALDRVRVDPERDRLEKLQKLACAEFMFFSAGPVEGTLGQDYLGRRALLPGIDLRFGHYTPLSYYGKRTGPAIVAAVRNAAGELTGAQATFLRPDGSKLDRLSFGSVFGCAVRLAPVGADGRLAVAEGVESALSFSALFEFPCWAALSAGSLERFEPPAGLSQLIVAADHDANGRGLEAAQTLAKRAQRVCDVAISMPPQPGDWNDVLVAEAGT